MPYGLPGAGLMDRMLIGLFVLTIGNRRGICANRYNSCGNYPNPKVNYNNNNEKYTKDKEPLFSSSYDALGAYRQKQISLDSTLWLRWKLDQRVIGSREVPIDNMRGLIMIFMPTI